MGAAVCVCQCVCEEERGTRWPWKLMVRWDRVRPTNSKPSWRAPSTSATSSGLGPWYLRAPGHVAEWRARLWLNGILFLRLDACAEGNVRAGPCHQPAARRERQRCAGSCDMFSKWMATARG